MKAFLLLLVYLTLGISLFSLQTPLLGLPQEFPHGWLGVWQEGLGLFAIPGVLLFFSWSKNSFFKWMRLLWSSSMSASSFILLWVAPTQFTQISIFGLCFIGLTGTLTLSLAMNTLFDLSKDFQGEQKKLRELLINHPVDSNPPVGKSQGMVFQRVEGT